MHDAERVDAIQRPQASLQQAQELAQRLERMLAHRPAVIAHRQIQPIKQGDARVQGFNRGQHRRSPTAAGLVEACQPHGMGQLVQLEFQQKIVFALHPIQLRAIRADGRFEHLFVTARLAVAGGDALDAHMVKIAYHCIVQRERHGKLPWDG